VRSGDGLRTTASPRARKGRPTLESGGGHAPQTCRVTDLQRRPTKQRAEDKAVGRTRDQTTAEDQH